MVKSRQITRREHIVPSMLLARFTDPSGVLWVYGRGASARVSRPESECWERDFYEYEFNGRKTNNKYENWLAEVEGEANRVLPLVASRQRLSIEDSVRWATFIASLFYRTRKVRQQISNVMVRGFRDKVQDPTFIRDMQCDLLRNGEFRFYSDLKRETEELLTQMERSPSFYHVSAIPHQTAWIAKELLKRRWEVVDAPLGKQFLISDCPVTTAGLSGHQGQPGEGFGKENTAVFLPIAPDKLFVISPDAYNWLPVAEPRAVDSVNLQAVQFGHKFVYASVNSDEIQALVDREIDRVKFGQTAFVPRARA